MLRPSLVRDNQPRVATRNPEVLSEFVQRCARLVSAPHLSHLVPVELEITGYLTMRNLVDWLQVPNIHTRRIVAQMVQMQTLRQRAMFALIKVAMRLEHLTPIVKETVAARIGGPRPNVARRLVAAIFSLPTLQRLAHSMSAIDVPRRTPLDELLRPRCADRDASSFAAATPTQTVGYIGRDLPPDAVLGGRSGYSLDDALLTGCPRRGVTARPAFPISKPNYTIGAAA